MSENHIDSDLNNETSELEIEKHSNQKYQVLFFLFAVAIVMFVLFFMFFKKDDKPVKEEIKKDLQTKIVNTKFEIQKKTFSDFMKEKEENLTQNEKKEEQIDNPFNKKDDKKNFKPQVLKGGGSLLVSSKSDNNTANKNTTTNNTSTPSNINDKQEAKEINSNYDSKVFIPTSARINPFNRDFLLQRGTFIKCSLDTRLVSEIEGFLNCSVSEDIYSSNGNVLLIEKGSKILGSFTGNSIEDGVNRLFVIWDEIRTPKGVIIPLNSGGADELGGSGIKGQIDHKWALRFSSAILVSLIDDLASGVSSAISSKSGNDNVNLDFSSTTDTASEMGTEVLKKFINIKPTLYKNQGDIVGVYVNRDIDFSKVYKLEIVK